MKQLCYCLFFWVQMSVIQAQIPYQVITSDIDHYWEAYDSIVATHDYAQKVALMNRLYIDRGSAGLHAFMKARDYSDTLFVNHILKYPKFWQSIRGKTLSIKNQTPLIAASLKRLKKLYPALRPAIMYFTIGGLRSGGTTDKDMVLIGSEILVGDSQTVVSEFTDEWLKSIFEAKETPDIVYLNTHEYIHTQQKDGFVNVLSQAIKEGSCDFIAELVLQQPIKTVYTDYGDAHFEAVKAAFKQDMFSDRTHWWLYNGRSKTNSAPDLGYYMGYKICQSYYQNAKNKRQAIKNIIELDYSNGVAVEIFLRDSHFFSEHIDPQQLLAEYQRNLPEIVQIEPFENGSHDVPTNIRYIKITFSKPMEAVSFDFSAYGPEHFPLANIAGYENDNRTIILETVALQPQTTYDFYVNNNNTQSKDGYKFPFKTYKIEFETQ